MQPLPRDNYGLVRMYVVGFSFKEITGFYDLFRGAVLTSQKVNGSGVDGWRGGLTGFSAAFYTNLQLPSDEYKNQQLTLFQIFLDVVYNVIHQLLLSIQVALRLLAVFSRSSVLMKDPEVG